MTLFDVREQTNPKPASHEEATFEFLNRVDSPFFDRVRAVMEDWFVRYPKGHRADLRARFRSPDYHNMMGAFWELYLHESLLRCGFSVSIHPDVPDVARKPDFLAERADGSFYMEATTVRESAEEEAAERRRSRVYDEFNKIQNRDFFLWVDMMSEGPDTPPISGFRAQIDSWLADLDPDEVAQRWTIRGFEGAPLLEIRVRGWAIDLRAYPKKPDARGKDDRPLGVYGPGAASSVDDVTPLRATLRAKASAYGRLPEPFVVAAMADAFVFSDIEYSAKGALYGSEAVRFNPGTGEARLIRQSDGLWYGPSGPRATGISGVLLGFAVKPWRIVESEPVIWPNPWAAKQLTVDLPWKMMRLNLDSMQFESTAATTSVWALLGLDSDWPGDEEPFPD